MSRSYRWDSAKVKEVLARKRETGRLPVNAAAEKSRLLRLLEDALGAPPAQRDPEVISRYGWVVAAVCVCVWYGGGGFVVRGLGCVVG